jgi:hypothetical protein
MQNVSHCGKEHASSFMVEIDIGLLFASLSNLFQLLELKLDVGGHILSKIYNKYLID